MFAIVLALGLATPVRFTGRTSQGSTSWQLWVFAAGAFVFSVGRLISTGSSPMPTRGLLIALNTLAAIAEEAIFRRVAFDAFLPAGPVAAIGCSAFLFALAHVTVYGWWALPIDLAAGVIFGWQRWASGGWAVPAATHALADLLVVI